MKFRTEVQIPESSQKIGIDDQIFSIGSCFASEMADLLDKGQLQTLNNPFGTLFNPHSINNAVKRLHHAENYEEADLIKYNEEVISLDHHSSFNSRFAHQTLSQINNQIQIGNQFLQEAKWIIITYGSSFAYEFLPKKKIVANCHKIPAKYFEKKLLTHLELTDSIYETILNLKDIADKNVNILFSVSPVRHTKDGMMENNLSKAKLISAIHEILPQFDNCYYVPTYEILMDDLRDYRFYREDLIHPNTQAMNYIWEKFGNAYFADDTMDFIEENFRIAKALEHRPADEQHPKHQQFREALKARIAEQQAKVSRTIF